MLFIKQCKSILYISILHCMPTVSHLFFFACGASFSEKSCSFFALFPILPHLSFLSATGAVWWWVVVRWSRCCSSSSKRRPAISQWPASPKKHSLNEAMALYRFCLMSRYGGHVFLFLHQSFGGDAVVGVYADVAGALQVGRVRSTLKLLVSSLMLSVNVLAVEFCPQAIVCKALKTKM